MDTWLIRPLAGTGLVARYGGLVLVTGPAPAAGRLLDVLRAVAAAGGDGRRLSRRLAGLLAAEDGDDLPAFVAVGPGGGDRGGAAVLVHGDAVATVVTTGKELVLDGGESATWVDRLVTGPVQQVRAVLAATATAGDPDPRITLDAGVVAGGGFLLRPGTAPVEPLVEPPVVAAEPMAPVTEVPDVSAEPSMAEPEPVVPVEQAGPVDAAEGGATEVFVPDFGDDDDGDEQGGTGTDAAGTEAAGTEPAGTEAAGTEPAATDAARTEPLNAPARPEPQDPAAHPETDPRPTVLGAYCTSEHFNDPKATRCAVCGVSMVPATHVTRPGPRPPLGVVVLDDGATIELDADFVLGREPEYDPDVLAGRARPLRVVDPEGVISRAHLRIVLDGWTVRLVDLGSSNGTHVQPPGSAEWQRLAPRSAVDMVPGTRVAMGRRGFLFESHRTAST